MSTDSVYSSALEPDPKDSEPVACASPASSGVTAALFPAAAALVALLLHRLLPSQQSDLPTRLYPLLLQALLSAALLLAIAQWTSQTLRGWVLHYGPLLTAAILLVCLLDLFTLKMAWLPLPYFPGPDRVLQGILDDRAILFRSTYHSLKLLLTGYFEGVALGFSWGILLGWFRRVRYWGMPWMKLIGPIPATAIIPLAMVMFTNSFFTGAALIALAVWFPVTMLTMSGIANVPVIYFDVAQTLGAKRAFLVLRIAIPAALPTIFVGFFMGLGASFLTLIVAETVGVKDGLGWYLRWQQGYAAYDRVYGALVIMALFFSGIMSLLFKARDWVMQWQKGVIRW